MPTSSRFVTVRGPLLVIIILLSVNVSQSVNSPPSFNLMLINYDNSIFNLLFSAMLFGLVTIAYVKRRKKVRLLLSLFLCSLSFLCWFSTDAKNSAEYNIAFFNQKFTAIILLGIGFWLFLSKSFGAKRRNFSEVVRKEAIRKQNGKCNMCKGKLMAYNIDLDHKNGKRSDNNLSNCQVLCVSCHRRKHAL